MSAKPGALVLIKAGNGADPEVFSTIGGLQISELLLDSQLLDASTRESGAWRQLLDGTGMRALTLTGQGIFTDSTSEDAVRIKAFGNVRANYRFYFGNGDYVNGAFIVSRYERSGSYDGEARYNITLQSAGEMSFYAA